MCVIVDSFPNLAKNGTLESRFGGGCIKVSAYGVTPWQCLVSRAPRKRHVRCVRDDRDPLLYSYYPPFGHIKDENISKDSNKPGSLAMANTGTPHYVCTPCATCIVPCMSSVSISTIRLARRGRS